jgi:flagellar export protein FliJ
MFRFRLQRVLEMRQRTERDAATALVSAQELVEQARAEQERLEAARLELATTAPGATPAEAGASIGALRTLHFLLDRLDEHVASAAQITTSAEQTAALKQDELRVAFRDRHTLDRLRDRHAESWRVAELAADRQQMDEIALTRFTQPSAAKSGVPNTNTES